MLITCSILNSLYNKECDTIQGLEGFRDGIKEEERKEKGRETYPRKSVKTHKSRQLYFK